MIKIHASAIIAAVGTLILYLAEFNLSPDRAEPLLASAMLFPIVLFMLLAIGAVSLIFINKTTISNLVKVGYISRIVKCYLTPLPFGIVLHGINIYGLQSSPVGTFFWMAWFFTLSLFVTSAISALSVTVQIHSLGRAK